MKEQIIKNTFAYIIKALQLKRLKKTNTNQIHNAKPRTKIKFQLFFEVEIDIATTNIFKISTESTARSLCENKSKTFETENGVESLTPVLCSIFHLKASTFILLSPLALQHVFFAQRLLRDNSK